MSITPYSFCMSLVWFSAFVFVADRLYRKTGFLLHYRMGLLLFLVGLSDEDYIDISPETSNTLRTREGEYHLYFDGEFFTVIPESELSVSPHDELKIYKE